MPKNPFPSLKKKEDYVLWLKLAKNNEIIGLNKVLTKWRKLDDFLSSDIAQKIKKMLLKYILFFEKKNFFLSLFYTLRLIFFAAYKKLYLQKN